LAARERADVIAHPVSHMFPWNLRATPTTWLGTLRRPAARCYGDLRWPLMNRAALAAVGRPSLVAGAPRLVAELFRTSIVANCFVAAGTRGAARLPQQNVHPGALRAASRARLLLQESGRFSRRDRRRHLAAQFSASANAFLGVLGRLLHRLPPHPQPRGAPHMARIRSFICWASCQRSRTAHTVGSGQSRTRAPELAQEGEVASFVGPRRRQLPKSVFPPPHEQVDPSFVMRERDRELDLLASRDPPWNPQHWFDQPGGFRCVVLVQIGQANSRDCAGGPTTSVRNRSAVQPQVGEAVEQVQE